MRVEPAPRISAATDPDWLSRWLCEGTPSREALARFDSLPPVEVTEVLGTWRGAELPTGHPLDGLLGLYGWRGKRFISADLVDPLLFEDGRTIRRVNPALIPIGLAVARPRSVRARFVRAVVRLGLPLLATRRPRARLRRVERAGVASAAMIYDDKPIIDHFRRLDDGRLIGLMEMRSTPAPYYFLLTRMRDGR